MAISKLEIFRTILNPEKNAKIDDIDAFLDNTNYATKTYTSDSYQYQKIELEIELKITAAQSSFNGLSVGNYARLTQDGRTYYYFILSNEWTSTNSCRLHCSIDTINTFADYLEWSDKTTILRQHNDRFINFFGGYIVERQFLYYRPTGNSMIFNFTSDQLKGKTIIEFQGEYKSSGGTGTLKKLELLDFNKNTGYIEFLVELRNPSDREVGDLTIRFNCEKGIQYKIDRVPEGLNPKLYGTDLGAVKNGNDEDSWYIIYNSNAAAETVSTYMCKDKAFNAWVSSSYSNTATFTANDLETGHYYFLDPFNGTAKKYKDKLSGFHYWKGEASSQRVDNGLSELIGETSTGGPVRGESNAFTYVEGIVFTRSGNIIELYTFKMDGDTDRIKLPEGQIIVRLLDTAEKISVRSDKVFKIFDSTVRPASEEGTSLYITYTNSPVKPIPAGDKEIATISPYSALDRTQSTLIKVIKFPYCPIEYTIEKDGTYRFAYNISKVSGTSTKLQADLLQLSTDMSFGSKVKSNLDNPMAIVKKKLDIVPNTSMKKDIKYETKLYNSEFYQPKFVYDSFGFNFDLEKVDGDQTIPEKLEVDFTPSRIFNSAMMFRFDDYKTDGLDNEDFNNILIANRNNEMPIYSSNYLNYIRNGYNYDVKSKNAYKWTEGINLAGQLAGTAIYGKQYYDMQTTEPLNKAIARSFDPTSTAAVSMGLSTIALVNQGVNLLSNISSTVISQIERAKAIERKKDELAAQAFSVSSADSIDLLQAYSGNKAKLKVYKTTDEVRNLLFDLFYYTGYAVNQKDVPNTTSRYWFNFIQCEPVFKGKDMLVYNNFINDITERYKQGVTVYHHRPETDIEYDINQERENWETNLVY